MADYQKWLNFSICHIQYKIDFSYKKEKKNGVNYRIISKGTLLYISHKIVKNRSNQEKWIININKHIYKHDLSTDQKIFFFLETYIK